MLNDKEAGERVTAINYDALPEHLRDGMRRYIEQGIPTGGFLRAVLENDFMGAVQRADMVTLHGLRPILYWLMEHAPPDCWGDVVIVSNWIASHRMRAAAARSSSS